MTPIRTIVAALALVAQGPVAGGPPPAFVVGEKLAGSVGFYDARFKRLGGVKVGVHRLRKRFRESIRAEIAQTVGEGADVDTELRYLIEVLSRASGGGS